MHLSSCCPSSIGGQILNHLGWERLQTLINSWNIHKFSTGYSTAKDFCFVTLCCDPLFHIFLKPKEEWKHMETHFLNEGFRLRSFCTSTKSEPIEANTAGCADESRNRELAASFFPKNKDLNATSKGCLIDEFRWFFIDFLMIFLKHGSLVIWGFISGWLFWGSVLLFLHPTPKSIKSAVCSSVYWTMKSLN